MGHARALLSLADEADQRRAGARCHRPQPVGARDGVHSSRKSSKAARRRAEAAAHRAGRTCTRAAAEDRLKLLLGTRVRIVRSRRTADASRSTSISEEELIRIYEAADGALIATEHAELAELELA